MQEVHEFARNFLEFNASVAAESLEKCSLEERLEFLSQLNDEFLSQTLAHLPPYLTMLLFSHLSDDRVASVLSGMDAKHSSAFFNRLEKKQKKAVLEKFPPDVKKSVSTLASFMPDTAGYYMDPSIKPIKKGTKGKSVWEIIRKDKRLIYFLYIADEKGKLVGVTTLRLVMQILDEDGIIDDIMETNVESIFVDEHRNDLLSRTLWHRFHAAPVVDYQNNFLGVIRYETIASLREVDSGLHPDKDLRVVSDSLSELYSIGFSALVGSASTLDPNKKPKESIDDREL